MPGRHEYHYDGGKHEMSAFFKNTLGFPVRAEAGLEEFLLTPDWGEGSIKRISLRNGLEIWKARTIFSKSFTCTYCRTSYSVFGKWNEGPHVERDSDNSLGYSDYQKGETIYRPGIVYDYVALAFRPGFFGTFPEFLPIIHSDSLNSSEISVFSYRIKAIFEQMRDCPMLGLRERLYMEGKSLELLSELLHLKTAARKNADGKWSKNEARCIQRVRVIIDEKLDENISLSELASLAGINTFKLTSGFRSFYGTSINSYRTRARMKKAEELLLSGEYNVSETAYMLGYKSTSHFSETFKKFYSVPPGDYRLRA